MPDEVIDVMRQLGALGAVLDDEIDDVGLDEVLPGAGRSARSERKSSGWLAVAAAVVVAVVGLVGLGRVMEGEGSPPAPGSPPEDAALVSALAGHTWVAIDWPLANLPWLRLERGGADKLELDGHDGCNHLEGSLRLDGTALVDGRVLSTAMACGTADGSPFPNITGLWPGAEFVLAEGVLTTSNPTEPTPPVRWGALDSFDAIDPADLIGEYRFGTTPLSISADIIDVDGCTATWAAVGSEIEVAEASCVPRMTGRWRAVGDADTVILISDGRYYRLDRLEPAPT